MSILISYIAAFVSVVIIDFMWIGVLMKDFYRKGLAPHIADTFNIPAAIVFYLVYAGGIVYFAILPAQSWSEAMLRGGILGFVSYCLYDLTNLATLKSWPIGLTIVDIFWGTILSAIVAGIGYAAMQLFIK